MEMVFALEEENKILESPEQILKTVEQTKYTFLKLGWEYDRLTKFPREALQYTTIPHSKMRAKNAPEVEGWKFKLPTDKPIARYQRAIPQSDFPWEALETIDTSKLEQPQEHSDKAKKLIQKIRDRAKKSSAIDIHEHADNPAILEYSILNSVYEQLINYGEPPIQIFKSYWEMFMHYRPKIGCSLPDDHENVAHEPTLHTPEQSYQELPLLLNPYINGFIKTDSFWMTIKQFTEPTQTIYRNFWKECEDLNLIHFAIDGTETNKILSQYSGSYIAITDINHLAVEITIYQKAGDK